MSRFVSFAFTRQVWLFWLLEEGSCPRNLSGGAEVFWAVLDFIRSKVQSTYSLAWAPNGKCGMKIKTESWRTAERSILKYPLKPLDFAFFSVWTKEVDRAFINLQGFYSNWRFLFILCPKVHKFNSVFMDQSDWSCVNKLSRFPRKKKSTLNGDFCVHYLLVSVNLIQFHRQIKPFTPSKKGVK